MRFQLGKLTRVFLWAIGAGLLIGSLMVYDRVLAQTPYQLQARQPSYPARNAEEKQSRFGKFFGNRNNGNNSSEKETGTILSKVRTGLQNWKDSRAAARKQRKSRTPSAKTSTPLGVWKRLRGKKSGQPTTDSTEERFNALRRQYGQRATPSNPSRRNTLSRSSKPRPQQPPLRKKYVDVNSPIDFNLQNRSMIVDRRAPFREQLSPPRNSSNSLSLSASTGANAASQNADFNFPATQTARQTQTQPQAGPPKHFGVWAVKPGTSRRPQRAVYRDPRIQHAASGRRSFGDNEPLRMAQGPPTIFDSPPPPSPAPPNGQVRIPVTGPDLADRVRIVTHKGRISMIARDAPVNGILGMIAQQHGLNIVSAETVTAQISVTLNDVALEEALSAILTVAGYTWVRQKDILYISPISAETRISPYAQGRQVRVFPLNFVAATDIDLVVQGLLSPLGQSFVTESNSTDRRRTREAIVIEDLPEYIGRIAEYIAQVDRPPRQVLIEAHILQVTLKDDSRHGVNFDYLKSISGTELSLKTTGFANAAASPAFFLGLNGSDLNALVEALKQTTDAKTLASPKVLAVNGQEARIQIGKQLGFLITTTTQTSTLQNISFLNVGVLLRVTPQITDDGQVLMTVKPEVSTGRINDNTGLPEEETTEVETTVLLPDGHGMLIGGLIKDEDNDTQTKIPIVGDLWLVGRLFQRRAWLRERQEIIIVLIPHIVPYAPDYQQVEETNVARATTRLLDGPLQRAERPWEPFLPDAMYDPRSIHYRRFPDFFRNLRDVYPLPPEYYFPSVNEEMPWLTSPEFESYDLFETVPPEFDPHTPPNMPPAPSRNRGAAPFPPTPLNGDLPGATKYE